MYILFTLNDRNCGDLKMNISKAHYQNQCGVCNKKGQFTAMIDDLDPHYFVSVCKGCFDKGIEYCLKKLRSKK